MQDAGIDVNRQMMLDGNATGGILQEIFGTEMTANWTRCASCGATGAIGTLLAFTRAPGTILRCPRCEEILMRIVERDDAVFVDLRGMSYLRLERPAT